MKVLVTGANGFIGRNLCQRLAERPDVVVVPLTRGTAIEALPELLSGVDFVIHLAGANRPADPSQFRTVNQELTESLCAAVVREADAAGRRIPILLASSLQVERVESDYARSKRAAEQAVQVAGRDHGLPVHVFRLPNVFGKWCRPNYNSVVATFCWNLARGLPIDVHDPAARLILVYIDDVVERFIELLDGAPPAVDSAGFAMIEPQYTCMVGEIAGHIRRFRETRTTLIPGEVGAGFLRALYATYLSYLPEEDFVYRLRERADAGGRFVEVLKTRSSGEVSYFTVAPGITRGGHYHHTRSSSSSVATPASDFATTGMAGRMRSSPAASGRKW